jgi:hypothetical protein
MYLFLIYSLIKQKTFNSPFVVVAKNKVKLIINAFCKIIKHNGIHSKSFY